MVRPAASDLLGEVVGTPWTLATYIARSAARSRSSSVPPWAGTAPRRRSPSARGRRSAGPRRWRWRSSPPARARSGRRRCRASARRTRRRPTARRGPTRAPRCAARSAAATSARSPASWPTVSLTTLNWSRSITIRQARPPSRPSRASVSVARRSNSARLGSPVRRVGRRPALQRPMVGDHPAEGERGERGADGELGADQPALLGRQVDVGRRRGAHGPRAVVELDHRRRGERAVAADRARPQQRLVRHRHEVGGRSGGEAETSSVVLT